MVWYFGLFILSGNQTMLWTVYAAQLFVRTRVRPFRLKIFFAYKRNKANLDPFHMCFTISLQNFTSFFHFFSLTFASNFSLRFTLVIFASKRNKAKRNSSIFFRFFSLFLLFFAFFRYFLLFFAFFAFFALNFSLRFTLVIFASKQNKARRNSSLFFRFFCFFSLFSLFFAFFRLIFVSLRFFRWIFAYFTFVFASDFWCFASKWIM